MIEISIFTIAMILFFFDILSPIVTVLIALAAIAWLYIGPGLYFGLGLFKTYYHDFLHWHTPDDSPQWSDGCSQHCKCRYCGKDIMQDSQGNWF